MLFAKGLRGAQIWVRLRAAILGGVLVALAACGGGGGGGGGDSPSANVSVSSSSVTLGPSYSDSQSPEPKSVTVTATGSGIAAVGAVFDPAYPPETWLIGQMTGSGSSFELMLSVNGQAAVGEHVAHLLVGAVDKDGNVLNTAALEVHYTVIARLWATTWTLGFSGINGADAPPAQQIQVQGEGLSWTAASADAWIHLDSSSGTGAGAIQVAVDDAGLASGHYEGSVVVTAVDGQTRTVPVVFDLTSTALTVSSTSLGFGGDNGRDGSGRTLQLSLGTEGNAYQWELSDVPDWLSPSIIRGSVDDVPQTITFTPNLGTLTPGNHSANMLIRAYVNGDVISQQIAVTSKVDSHRLYASEDGAAFTSTPGWSRLTRTVQINDNFNRATPWTAVSDAAWLTVTGSGTAGANLVMTANPASLAADSLSTATVTVSSSDPTVSEKVYLKVGLWKGSSTPSANVVVSGTAYKYLANDAIRPYVYATTGGSSIDVYNVYTGTKVQTISAVGNAIGSMVVSSDGQRLFAVDEGFKRVAVINLASMTKTSTLATSGPTYGGYSCIVPRITGVAVLVCSDRTAFRVADGKQIGDGTGPQFNMTAALAGSRIYDINAGLSPSGGSYYATDYSVIDGGKFLARFVSGAEMGSNGQDIAVSPDGATVYTASGAPYVFNTYSGSDMGQIGHLPEGDAYPNNVEVGSDGRVAGGISGWYSTWDIWLYNAGGAIVGRYKVAGYARSLLQKQLVFSGDATILITLTDDPRLVFIPIGP